METLEKVKSLELLEAVFHDQDYKEFLELVEDNQDKVAKVDTYPIDNYSNKAINSTHMDTLRYLYQNVKYYLQTKKAYAPKMQEGIAIFASKVAIMNAYYPGSIDNYFRAGDGSLLREMCNPFEEITRLLLSVVKDEYWSNPNKAISDYALSFDKLRFEDKAYLKIVQDALNGKQLRDRIDFFYSSNILDAIGRDLEFSNITSFEPLTATTKDNRELILEQINRCVDLYHMKVDVGVFSGTIPNWSMRDKLLSKFDDRTFYAKRNIGIYERTKELIKEC